MAIRRSCGLLFLICAVISGAHAAPIPGTATSLLTAPETGHFFSLKGFRLGTQGTHWNLIEDDGSEAGSTWRYTNTQSRTASVQIKTDYLKAELSLEAYARRWMRDYSQLGLDVLGTRSFQVNGGRGIVVDLMQPKKKLQLRQAVFLKRKMVVVMTCSDERSNFMSTLPDCNELIKNFKWAETSSPKAF